MEEPGVQADRRDEHGQVVLVLLLWITAGLAGLALVAVWSAGAARSGRAQTVADAVALAEGAATFANPPADADAVTVQRVGDRIRVTAQVGRQVAHAEVLVQTSPTQRRHGLAPSMVAAVARAEQLLGVPLDIRSGHRSREEQQRLWDQRATNPYPVARPGTSLHERGLAIDVALSQVAALREVAELAGLCHPLPQIDPVHFVACPIPE